MKIKFYKLLKDCNAFMIIPSMWIDFQTKGLKISWLVWGIEFDFGGVK